VSKSSWIIFTVLVAVVFGSLVLWSQKNTVDVSKINSNKAQAAIVSSGNIADHVFGNKNAKVVLIEYGDFQCPGCGDAHPFVKTVTEKYKANIAFIFRNFPITTKHPNARAAAAAAEIAGLMGKYWPMHNILYEKQTEWSGASAEDRAKLFTSYASQIGLNASDFKKLIDKKDGSVNRKINFDLSLGRKDNVEGTPTFRINGTALSSDKSGTEGAFDAAIRDAIKKAGVTP